jgi:dUTP pyrophosphatase
MNVRITKLDPRAVIPSYQTSRAAAWDLTVIEDVTIPPHTGALLRTGLCFRIPDEHVMLIFARSSTLPKMGLMLGNGVGVIDADFAGPEDEVRVSVFNPSDMPIHVKAGSRPAQAMILPRPQITFEEGSPDSISRGAWGSTGGHGA